MAHQFQIYEGEKLYKNRYIFFVYHIYTNKKLLLNAWETKREKYLCKYIFQDAVVPDCTSVLLVNFCRT